MTWNLYSRSNKSVNLSCRVGVLITNIKCIFIHKSETWTETKQTEKKIYAFGTWYYRKIMLIGWKVPVCYESALVSVDNCSLYAATLRTWIQENRFKILQQLEKLAEENAKLSTGDYFDDIFTERSWFVPCINNKLKWWWVYSNVTADDWTQCGIWRRRSRKLFESCDHQTHFCSLVNP